MIIRSLDDYFLIKVFKDSDLNFNIYDMDSIKEFFQAIFDNMSKKYDLHGLIDVDVYVNDCYGIIIEMRSMDSYFDEVDMRISVHLTNEFLVEISNNDILDYENVYYYKGKFYGTYKKISDSEVFYKNTDEIIDKGIKVC